MFTTFMTNESTTITTFIIFINNKNNIILKIVI